MEPLQIESTHTTRAETLARAIVNSGLPFGYMLGGSYNHNWGYGNYYPVTIIGRIIAVFVMFSRIGIVVSILGSLSQRRMQKGEARFSKKTEVQPRFGDEMKTSVKKQN